MPADERDRRTRRTINRVLLNLVRTIRGINIRDLVSTVREYVRLYDNRYRGARARGRRLATKSIKF
eukprot:SAG31_NODE_1502_length_8080_cov_131.725849_4_plen_66_part_00